MLGTVMFYSAFMLSRARSQLSYPWPVTVIMESTSAKRHLMPLAYGRARATDGADAREAEAEPLHSRPERVKVAEWVDGGCRNLCPSEERNM